MKEFFNSTGGRWATGMLAAVVIFLVAFGLGVSVGYQKAIFSSEWGMNYERNFSGLPPIGIVAQNMPQNMHGAAGIVIDVSGSGLSVKDNDNDEQSIIVASDTVIKKMDATIPLGNVAVGDHVVVIGAPNSSGQVEARFIRVFPAPGPGDGSPQPQL
jgi:hypothetical protein